MTRVVPSPLPLLPPHAAVNARHAAVLATALVNGGVRHTVISPGSRSTPLVLAFDALSRAKRVTPHVVIDERSAAFFALGLARSSESPVALLCTSGSAAAHYLPAVIEAAESGVPLILLTADRPRELHACGAAQTIGQDELFGRFVRWHFTCEAPTLNIPPDYLNGIGAQALDWATRSPQGPVHLNFPFREPLWDVESAEAVNAELATHTRRTTGPSVYRLRGSSKVALDRRVLERMVRNPRGVIAVGPMVPLNDDVLTLAQRLNWPILADGASPWRFIHRPHIISSADALLRSPTFATAARPDFVIRLGRVATSKAVASWLGSVPPNSTILIDRDAWHDPYHAADTLLAGDVPAILRDVVAAVKATSPAIEPGWLSAWIEAEAFAQGVFDESVHAEPLWEGSVARYLAETAPKAAAIHLASSMPIRDFDSFAGKHRHPATVFCNRGANGIDGTLATALGEALAEPKRPLILLLGDLAFLHDLGSLLTLSHYRHTVRMQIVVVDNGGGAIFEFLPIGQHPTAFTRYFLTPQIASISAIAETFEFHVLQAADGASFRRAVDSTSAKPGIHILHVLIDRDANLHRHRQIWNTFSRAAGTWIDQFRHSTDAPWPTKTADPRGRMI